MTLAERIAMKKTELAIGATSTADLTPGQKWVAEFVASSKDMSGTDREILFMTCLREEQSWDVAREILAARVCYMKMAKNTNFQIALSLLQNGFDTSQSVEAMKFIAALHAATGTKKRKKQKGKQKPGKEKGGAGQGNGASPAAAKKKDQ